MNGKRVTIYVDESDQAARQQVEAGVSKVLASYPNSVLAEVDEQQLEALRREGFSVEVQEGAQMIRLRAVEFDTSEAEPATPATLSLSAAERAERRREHWIVQFVGPAKAEWGEEIRSLGGKMGDYIPENAFLVEMSQQIADDVRDLPFVSWVGLYEPAYKVSPLLMGRRDRASAGELGTLSISPESFEPTPLGNVNVHVHDPSDLGKVSEEIERLGGTVVTTAKDRIRASLDLAQADKVAKLAEVKWIEPYSLPVLDNDVAAPIIGVQPVWDNHGLDGEGQIVAVSDSGLDTGVNDATMHDDFEGRIVNIHSWAVQNGHRGALDNTSWDDGAADVDSGHGTHVAGSVLGNGTRSGGSIRGMAPAARLVFQALEQWADWKPETHRADRHELLGIPDDLNQLFQQAYNDGARIHSNSWNDRRLGQYTGESEDIDEFMWNHKDSVIVFSASNAGQDADRDGVVDNDSLGSQACAKNCITVGASENNRATGGYNSGGVCDTYGTCWPLDFPDNPLKDDALSDDPEGMVAFSGRGPTDDGRVKPDVVAPGTNILSVRSSRASGTGWGLLPAGNANRNFYMYMGGTSMSTPLVAGMVALIRQYVQKVHLHASPSGALLKALLIHGATPMTGQYTPSEVGDVPDNSQGWGRANLENSLFPSYPVKIEFRDNPAHALGTGEHRDYTFQVADSTVPFRATLVWTDFPSAPAAGGSPVNRLRLSITDPSGTTVQSAPANNNVQQVVIDNPATGTYTVRVTGVNVTTQVTRGQKQDFALVVGAGLQFVDVYIRDNHGDHGIAPSKGTLYRSPDIWVSLTNDPAAAPAANPEYGQTNYVFVKVHNGGSQAAANATVKLYWAEAGTNLSRPHWKTDDIKVNGAAGNTRKVSVPARTAAGDGEATTAAFEWTPPDPATNVVEPGHFCFFATVTHPNDPILQEDVDAVRWEDNLAWKNVNIKDMLPDTTTTMEFYVGGVAGASSVGDLHIDRSGLPAGGSVKLKIPSRYLEDSTVVNLQEVWRSEGGRVCRVEVTSNDTADLNGISLKPGENTLARLEVTLPEDAVDGDVYPVFVEQRVNGNLTGRVTLMARTVGTPAYIANRRSRELHLPNCEWVKKMSPWNKIPYDDLDAALRRGYNGCRFCLPDYDTG